MKKFCFLLLLLLGVCAVCFVSCGNDDDDELKVETQLLISLKDGTSGIDGQVFVFPAGNYDPSTFKYSTLGSIETTAGQKVTSLAVGSYSKNGGYCKYTCKPSSYYVVGVYMGTGSWGGAPKLTWKGQSATAAKDKGTIVEIKLSTNSYGCQN